MNKNLFLLTACLFITLTLALAGCSPQETLKDVAATAPTTSEPESKAPEPASASSEEAPVGESLYLPTLFNSTAPNSDVETSSTQGLPLPPDRWQEWPVLPALSGRAVEIYRAGLAQGRDPTHFSKVGDCQNIHQYFLGLFDQPETHRLGENYAYLQETIDYFAGSWSRSSEAVRTGFNVASVLSPLHADPAACQPAETPLACEIRLWNPSFAIISMETWTPDRPVKAYEDYLRQIIEYAISQNVLPILATKADNLEGDHAINQIVANLAAEYDIPLWNFWAATHPLTDEGLMEDGFHLTNGPNYYDDPQSLDLGWPIRNLTGLLLVDTVWKATR